MDNFVPLTELRSVSEMKADPFFAQVVKRNTMPDGRDKDPGIYRRLQHENCQACQSNYKEKYPDTVFKPVCQGISDIVDFKELAEATGMEVLEAAEFLDVETWMETYIVIPDKDGTYHPYSSESRPFQRPVLQCTAKFQVDRMARGLGKTALGVGTELHKAMNNKNYPILVLCPHKSQAELWYQEIMKQFENSPMLKGALRRSKQAPFYEFVLWNGSTIRIFTAGSSAGRGADSIRGQSPRRVRLDEQDYLVEADYNAVMAMLRRYDDSEFHGSSTPKGTREMYWSMCTQFPEYKEFYIPVTARLDWSPEQEAILRKESKTADRYNHEYMALFGDLEQGVFKGITVDTAKKHYNYAEVVYDTTQMKILEVKWNDCKPRSGCHYVAGIDWNGKGTGTRIRITEFDTKTKMRRCVYKETIDKDGSTTLTSMEHIRQLNRIWHLDHIYCDKGFGFAQDELIRQMGANPHPDHKLDDERLLKVKFIGSKENLRTNRLVPKRDPNSPYIEDSELDRQTKPFMVEGCQMAMEQLRVEFSTEDERLEAQMRDYRVKTYTANGQANSYEAKTEGDHDLDAWVLSMLGIELNYGLFFEAEAHVRLAGLTHVSSFGSGIEGKIEAARQRMALTNTPTRVSAPKKQDEWETRFSARNGSIVAPARSASDNSGQFRQGIRTSTFRTATQHSRSSGLGSTGRGMSNNLRGRF